MQLPYPQTNANEHQHSHLDNIAMYNTFYDYRIVRSNELGYVMNVYTFVCCFMYLNEPMSSASLFQCAVRKQSRIEKKSRQIQLNMCTRPQRRRRAQVNKTTTATTKAAIFVSTIHWSNELVVWLARRSGRCSVAKSRVTFIDFVYCALCQRARALQTHSFCTVVQFCSYAARIRATDQYNLRSHVLHLMNQRHTFAAAVGCPFTASSRRYRTRTRERSCAHYTKPHDDG